MQFVVRSCILSRIRLRLQNETLLRGDMLYQSKSLRRGLSASLSILAVATAAPAVAEEVQPSDTDKEQSEDHLHNTARDGARTIVVTVDGLEELDFIAGQDVLTVEDIQQNLDGQLGEVLAKVPGVSATSFAPGASRPILRGQDGERVRVLLDGVGTADAANTSADHATTIDPLTAIRVEVLRGPAALLYGSQAIGGVVNVLDRRLPLEVPDEPFHFDAMTAFDTANDLVSGGASIDIAAGDSIVLHADASYRETGDRQIPGFQLTDAFRNDLLADADEEEEEGELEEAEELREAANQSGYLPNSSTEMFTVNGGIGVFLGESSLAASVGYFETDYGLVGRPGAGHHHGEEGEEGDEEEGEEEGEETVSIGLEQIRADLRANIYLGTGFFSNLQLRGGFSDYTHTEFEGDEVGTVFNTETAEVRAELIQNGGGVIGLQYSDRDFAAVGEEAFVAPNQTTQFAVFTVQEFDLGGIELEAAGRYERVDVSSNPLGVERDFDLFSGALSVVKEMGEGIRGGLTLSRSQRAPAGEELFADGPHIATQSFEIGDVDLEVESAWGGELFARGNVGSSDFGVSVFYQSFDDYIFLSPTGEEEDELPVFQFLQEDASFFGFEADIVFPIVESDEGLTLMTDLRASYVDGSLDESGDLPRIPPLSLLGALDAEYGNFGLRGEIQWFGEQTDIAEFETPTDDFALTNLYFSWRPLADNRNVVLQIAGENLFNVTGRRHSSFSKDYLPLTGRNVRASVRLSF